MPWGACTFETSVSPKSAIDIFALFQYALTWQGRFRARHGLMTWDTDVAVSRVFPRGAICLVWRIRTVKGPHSRLVVRVEVVK